ncbi:hypothetical protein DWS13_00150 [Campylobacter upsaliensis]|nr:hypothetical protein [Campylobacter upsaliensis]
MPLNLLLRNLKPFITKQFSPLEKKRLKRFKFLKWITLAECESVLNFTLSTFLNSRLTCIRLKISPKITQKAH